MADDDTVVSGLRNTGNTCFFNSVLQALASLPVFHEYVRGILLVHERYDKLLRRQQKKVESDMDPAAKSSDAGDKFDPPQKSSVSAQHADANVGGVAARILSLMRALSWPRGSFPRSTYVPSVALGEFSSTFEDAGQHDAQELLLLLLHTLDDAELLGHLLHAEDYDRLQSLACRHVPPSLMEAVRGRVLKSRATRTATSPEAAGKGRGALAVSPLEPSFPKLPPCVTRGNPCRGEVATRVVCDTCGDPKAARPWLVDEFQCLSLEMRRPQYRSHASSADPSSSLSVEDCLGYFFANQRIEGFFCGSGATCRRAGATKRSHLLRAPRILLLHFKRAVAPGRKSFVALRFGLELDVAPWVSPPAMGVTASHMAGSAAGGGGSSRSSRTPVAAGSTRYRLHAVVEHLGGGLGGHYVTYRRVPSEVQMHPPDAPGLASHESTTSTRPSMGHTGPSPARWAYASDATVNPAVAADVIDGPEAYLLAYQLIEGGAGMRGGPTEADLVAGSERLGDAELVDDWLKMGPLSLMEEQQSWRHPADCDDTRHAGGASGGGPSPGRGVFWFPPDEPEPSGSEDY